MRVKFLPFIGPQLDCWFQKLLSWLTILVRQEFDSNKKLNLKGVVTKVDWINPTPISLSTGQRR